MRHRYGITNTRLGPAPDSLDHQLNPYLFVPTGYGHQRRDPEATCPFRVIGDFELIFVLDGETQVRFESEPLRLHAGEAVLIPPFVPHAIDTPRSDPHDNYWVHFDVGPAYLQPVFLRQVSLLCRRVLRPGNPRLWRETFARFEQVVDQGMAGTGTLFRATLLELMVLLFRDCADTEAPGGIPCGEEGKSLFGSSVRETQERLLVRTCTEAVLSDLAADWSCERLAGLGHVSETSLRKAFSGQMGMSPHQFVLLARVRRAEALLLTTGCTLEDIADQVGFSSAHALHAAFRRVYGLSPRQWKQQAIL
jgi:AraC-like DNA-binding protein